MSHDTPFLDACPLCPLQTFDLLGKNVELIEILEHLGRENIESHHVKKPEQDARKSLRTSKFFPLCYLQ